MKAQLVQLYVRLLAWLPAGFRAEFAEEMGQVALARMGEAGRRGGVALLWLFLDEVCALPGLWLFAWRRERRATFSRSGKEAVMSAAPGAERSRPARDWSLGLWWALASAAGTGLGIGAAVALLFLAEALVGGFDEDRDFKYLLVPLLALCMPLFQWLVLRGRIARPGRWFLATGAGVVLYVVGLAAVARFVVPQTGRLGYTPWLVLVMALAIGGSLGVPQWAVLRRSMRMGGLWAVASVLGWALALASTGESIDGAADVIALAVMPGLWTGLALALLWKQDEEQAPAAA